jgi:hypothetical protein
MLSWGTYSVGIWLKYFILLMDNKYLTAVAQRNLAAMDLHMVLPGLHQSYVVRLTAECTDHALIPATLKAGDTINVNPGDWYAPEGTFPPMPVQ